MSVFDDLAADMLAPVLCDWVHGEVVEYQSYGDSELEWRSINAVVDRDALIETGPADIARAIYPVTITIRRSDIHSLTVDGDQVRVARRRDESKVQMTVAALLSQDGGCYRLALR